MEDRSLNKSYEQLGFGKLTSFNQSTVGNIMLSLSPFIKQNTERIAQLYFDEKNLLV